MVDQRSLNAERQAMGTRSSAELGPVTAAVLAHLAAGQVRRVLDIGCGQGGLAAALVRRGYAVTGIDPQAGAVATARSRAPGAEFHVAGAEAIPARDMSFGAAILMNTLHHIPGPLMHPALAEAFRVLRPMGLLVVVEPLAEGSFFDAMRPLDDETTVRAQALAALAAFETDTGAQPLSDTRVERISRFAGLDAFLSYVCQPDPGRAEQATRQRAAIAAAFERAAEPAEGLFVLRQPHLLRVLRRP